MTQIDVDGITGNNGVEIGVITSDFLIKKFLGQLPDQEDVKLLLALASIGNTFHSFLSISQYVVYVEYNRVNGLCITLTDFSDMDSALEYYSKLLSAGWKQEDRDALLRVFQDVENQANPRASLHVVPIR